MRQHNQQTAILLGSSRSDGNTSKLVHQVATILNAKVFDLNDYQIKPFDYNIEHNDDFMPLIQQLLAYPQILFASPMYWYSASAQMKIFFDRITDLLNQHKEQGRKLRTKTTALLATGGSAKPASCFEQMFSLTFDYLGMDYRGMLYCDCSNGFVQEDGQQQLEQFLAQLS